MRTREISREQWASFLDEFSRRHLNEPATVEVLEERLGAQVEASGLPFQGAIYDADAGTITIELGKTGHHIEHPVRAPQRAWVEIDDDGAEAALQIEVSDGTKTILDFG